MSRLEPNRQRAPRQSRKGRSVWEDPSVAANPDAPSVQKALSSEKWKRRALVTVAFGVLPAIFLMGAGLFAQATTPAANSGAGDSRSVNDSPGKAEAFRAISEWLHSDPAPIPGGELVSWDGFSVELPPPVPANDSTRRQATYRFETHSFTIARGPILWSAHMLVVVGDIIGATASGPPSLTPMPDIAVSATTPWFELSSTSVSPAVTQSVEVWAQAFASGSSDRLRQAIQDRNTDRSYVPLYGVQEFVSASVVASGARPLADSNSLDSSTVVVRVQLYLWWDGGKPVVAPNQRVPSPTPIAYDLLIEYANTATPVVVAWGAPGAGPHLSPYQNAVHVRIEDARKVVRPPQADPTTPAAPTDSSEPDQETGGGDE